MIFNQFRIFTIFIVVLATAAYMPKKYDSKRAVLIVCLGNICRSPMAAAIFRHLLEKRHREDDWKVESASTSSMRLNENIDPRAAKVLRSHRIDFEHTSRQIKIEDFNMYDYILAMDEKNVEELRRRAPEKYSAKIELLGNYDPHGYHIIEDPYYGDQSAFEACYDHCYRSVNQFIIVRSK